MVRCFLIIKQEVGTVWFIEKIWSINNIYLLCVFRLIYVFHQRYSSPAFGCAACAYLLALYFSATDPAHFVGPRSSLFLSLFFIAATKSCHYLNCSYYDSVCVRQRLYYVFLRFWTISISCYDQLIKSLSLFLFKLIPSTWFNVCSLFPLHSNYIQNRKQLPTGQKIRCFSKVLNK